jgi:hypothetical protein
MWERRGKGPLQRKETIMTQYMLSVFDGGDADQLTEEETAAIYADVDAVNAELMEAGAWVFAGGLHPADTATVVTVANDETVVTDGPYAETKEHVGGFWVIEAADLDAALDWAGKATRACRGPIEVRPFQDEPEV